LAPLSPRLSSPLAPASLAPPPASVTGDASPRAGKATDIVSVYEARIAKYEADAAALRAELNDEREKNSKLSKELKESVPVSQHRAEVVALEVRLAAHDLTNEREVHGLKAALSAATTARIKSLDAEWTQRWEAREAKFREQWDAREDAYNKVGLAVAATVLYSAERLSCRRIL
jgi:hypothetical protein